MKKNNQLVPMGIFNKGMHKNNNDFLALDFELWLRRTFIRLVIAIIIIVVILAISSINTKPTNYIISEIECRIHENFHINDSYHKMKIAAKEFTERSNRALKTMNFGTVEEQQFIKPKTGNITIGFNDELQQTDSLSKGIVIEGEVGANVLAVQEGVVIELGTNQSVGNYIIVKHRGELLSVYKNLQENLVRKNQKILIGEVIGKSSGKLQFEVWHEKRPVNPLQYINHNAKSL
ncbi:MAG: M23 family metallopeptidase [Clostridiaceae bacterium]|nr:M23 family metallopeptidase [Clostridiaceae bacterium]